MVNLTGESLTIDEVADVAFRNEPIAPLSDAVQQQMQASQAWIEDSIRKEKIIYVIP